MCFGKLKDYHDYLEIVLKELDFHGQTHFEMFSYLQTY